MPRRFDRRPLTDAERNARRQADRERIERAARELLTSDGWRRWIRVRATNGLSRYSLRNQWLITTECHARGITPTYIAGYRAFLQLNRCVRKGQRASRILAPVAVTQRDEHGDQTGERRVFFRTVPVFDVSMTDPLPGLDPIPLEPPAEPIEGDSHAHLIPRLTVLADRLGYRVDVRDLPDHGPGGWCNRTAKQIVFAAGPANRQVRTLVHELAHALGLAYQQYGRERAEVLVDSVTYIVCCSAGLNVAGEAVPYIAGWGEHGALDAIHHYAETIDTVARRIENALNPDPDPTHRPPTPPWISRWPPDVRFGRAARPEMVGQGLTAVPGAGRMQPPTEPARHQASSRRLRGDEAELYRRHRRDLEWTLSRAVNASPALIEDACQTAWAQFLRCQPNRETVWSWLYTVALHEAYRLAGIERRELHIADLSPSLTWDGRLAHRVSLDDQLEARDALRAVARLPESQRRDLALLVGGFSYRDIAQLTGGRTYTNVNKHLVKARARLRAGQSDEEGANRARQRSS